MEESKHVKPYFSQAADRLNDRINKLIGDAWHYEEEKNQVVITSLDGGASVETSKDAPGGLKEMLEGRESPSKLGETSVDSRKRSPHRAYYIPPKNLGWKPIKTHTSMKRSKQKSQSPTHENHYQDPDRLRLNQDLSQHGDSQASLAGESQKSYKSRRELVSRVY